VKMDCPSCRAKDLDPATDISPRDGTFTCWRCGMKLLAPPAPMVSQQSDLDWIKAQADRYYKYYVTYPVVPSTPPPAPCTPDNCSSPFTHLHEWPPQTVDDLLHKNGIKWATTR
jgi:hypothetical protein